jgi:hypothetical protein
VKLLTLWLLFEKGGFEMDKKEFDDFVARLTEENKGDRVDSHCTAHPLYIVQSRKREYGIDPDFGGDGFVWVMDGTDYTRDELIEAFTQGVDDNEIPDFSDAEKVCYRERWEYVSAHFTREGAEAYIQRKKHDHRGMRIYVESQVHAHEFNAVVEALIGGQIVFKDSGV